MLLALIAIVVTAGACVLVWRARRSAHHLAQEMVELRDRLAAAERAHLEAAAIRSTDAGRDEGENEALASRMIAFEASVRNTIENTAREQGAAPVSGDEALDAPRTRAIQHLEARGYENVAVIEMLNDGRLLIEAVRAGVTSKGYAVMEADGRVRVQFRTSLRAFP